MKAIAKITNRFFANEQSQKWIFLTTLVVLASWCRLLPHMPNFTPVLALGLFAGFLFKRAGAASIVTFASMLLTDYIIGFHDQMLGVYGSLFAICWLGTKMKNSSSTSLLGHGTLSSLVFFVLSNFYVWISTPFYEKSVAGLLQCFYMAIPFYPMTWLSTVVYAVLFFKGYQMLLERNWLRKLIPQI